MAEDLGAIDPNAGWPLYCIDWDQAARDLRMDYTEIAVRVSTGATLRTKLRFDTPIEVDEDAIFEVDMAAEAQVPTLALAAEPAPAEQRSKAGDFDLIDEDELDAKLAAISAELTGNHAPIARSVIEAVLQR